MAGCNKHDNTYQGWVEANLIFVAPDEVGRVQTLAVKEGDVVKVGDPLFTVDDDLQQADLAQVKASLVNARQTFDRADQLAKSGAGTQKDLDSAVAVLRDAQARLNSSQTRLARRSIFSAVDGVVQQIYYRPGEMVPAGTAGRGAAAAGQSEDPLLRARNHVAEIAYGDVIAVACDGCAKDLTARVSFIARQSEFTPPVIYSLEERTKLVFLIEALPEKPSAFRVGQPLDVTLCRSAAIAGACRPSRTAGQARGPAMNGAPSINGAPASDIVIDVRGLTKSFGDRTVVRDLSMQVRRGTIFGFLGPNGSGKTTTIRMLCGLLTPDAGEGTCLGYDIRTEAPRSRPASAT